MSWWVMGPAIAVIVIIIAVSSMWNDSQNEIDELKNELKILKERIDGIDSRLDSHSNRIKAFNKKVASREYQERRLK